MTTDTETTLPLTEQAYRTLRKAIIQCEFAPDERLRVDELSTRYGISSSPIREALTRLVEQGLVRSIENRGFRVASISVAGIADLTRVRLLVECEALCDAMKNGNDEWEGSVVAAAHSLSLAEQRLSDGPVALNEAWSERHRAFHLALYSSCSSPLMLSLIELLFDSAERYRRYSARHRSANRRKNQEHQILMEAVLTRDETKAIVLLRKHILGTERNVSESLNKEQAIQTPA